MHSGFHIYFLMSIAQFHQQPGAINQSTFSKSFREWRFCQSSILNQTAEDRFTCPVCVKNCHSTLMVTGKHIVLRRYLVAMKMHFAKTPSFAMMWQFNSIWKLYTESWVARWYCCWRMEYFLNLTTLFA